MNTCHILRMLLDGLECLRIEYIAVRIDELDRRRAVLTTTTDDDAHAIAKGFGVELREVTAGDSVWLSVGVDLEGVNLVVTGPTRKRAPRLEVIP